MSLKEVSGLNTRPAKDTSRFLGKDSPLMINVIPLPSEGGSG